jgi:hypothetical protein
LCPRRERPTRRRAAEKRDEVAPVHPDSLISSHGTAVSASATGSSTKTCQPRPVTATLAEAVSEEKREPASDINTPVVDGLKVLDPKRPIREADMERISRHVIDGPILLQKDFVHPSTQD